jgi:phospholipase/carboxylesterase
MLTPAAKYSCVFAVVLWLMAAEETGTAEKETVERGHGYLLALPAQSRENRPLLVALHGTDSSPDSAMKVWAQAAREADIYLLCPGAKGGNWDIKADKPHVLGLVHLMLEGRRVDSERVYLAGFSAGATMADILRQAEPSLFAAVVLIAGHFDEKPNGTARKEPRTAVHIVHGKRDTVFPPSTARDYASVLRGRGHAVALTELPEMGHEHPPASEIQSLVAWMLSFRRGALRSRPQP